MNVELLLMLILTVAIAAIVMLVVQLRRNPLAAELRAEREANRGTAEAAGRLQGQLGAATAELEAARGRHERDAAELATLRGELEAARTQAGLAERSLAERSEALASALRRAEASESTCGQLRDEVQRSERSCAELSANLEHAQRARAEMQAFIDEARARLSSDFAALAGKVFDERGKQFEASVRAASQQGRTDIEGLLKPFQDRLGEFRTRIDTLYSEEAKERSALFGAVTELKTLNQDMAGHTAALTRALKGSSKVRGDWGELILESVLRGSGLEEGVHFERQAGVRDDDGRALRPDVVVFLPDERHVVVDSKVNLIAWQEAMAASDEPELHSVALRRHCEGLRRHVRDLADRAYPAAIGANALDVTIAFVPIEGALSAALGHDPTLQTFAFENKVVFASPNTLMALLRVVDRLWTRDRIHRQALQIGETGGKLLDALQVFLEDFDQVGTRLDQLHKSYGSAKRRLDESSQSVLARARRLTELGVRGKKALREDLRPDIGVLPIADVEAIGNVGDPVG
ncbi:DNA recombination protein RmuC [Luteimonas sp. MC1828]|uniref:DNA recombination protein RmuC n=1 Tax=Luteimonas sp. MC1828 TaxID=2799787 RepID=UPI0018F22335|nr:DNA recombination protein RmuC [Luteimonas sp. MC1828]MBJ7575424.1 DNA recombination protein RmuC [Luteimonas sp. MC1828]